MTQMTAVKTGFKYGRQRLVADQDFDCRPEHVRTLSALGVAKVSRAKAVTPKAPTQAVRPRRPRASGAAGRYSRRDLRAKP